MVFQRDLTAVALADKLNLLFDFGFCDAYRILCGLQSSVLVDHGNRLGIDLRRQLDAAVVNRNNVNLRARDDLQLRLLHGGSIHAGQQHFQRVVVEHGRTVHFFNDALRRLALAEAGDVHFADVFFVRFHHRIVESSLVDVQLKHRYVFLRGSDLLQAHFLFPPKIKFCAFGAAVLTPSVKGAKRTVDGMPGRACRRAIFVHYLYYCILFLDFVNSFF